MDVNGQWSQMNQLQLPYVFLVHPTYLQVSVKHDPELDRWSWGDHILDSVYEGVSGATAAQKIGNSPRQQEQK